MEGKTRYRHDKIRVQIFDTSNLSIRYIGVRIFNTSLLKFYKKGCVRKGMNSSVPGYLLGNYPTEVFGKVRYGIETEHSSCMIRYELDTCTRHFGLVHPQKKTPRTRTGIPYLPNAPPPLGLCRRYDSQH